jgi:hypothetical protein
VLRGGNTERHTGCKSSFGLWFKHGLSFSKLRRTPRGILAGQLCAARLLQYFSPFQDTERATYVVCSAEGGRHAHREHSGSIVRLLRKYRPGNMLTRRLTLCLSGEGGRPDAQRGHPGGRDEARPACSRGRDHAHHCTRHKRRHPTEAAERHPATSRESLDPLRSLVFLRSVLTVLFGLRLFSAFLELATRDTIRQEQQSVIQQPS